MKMVENCRFYCREISHYISWRIFVMKSTAMILSMLFTNPSLSLSIFEPRDSIFRKDIRFLNVRTVMISPV